MSCLPGCARPAGHRGGCSKKPLKVRYRMLKMGDLAELEEKARGLGLKTIIAVSKVNTYTAYCSRCGLSYTNTDPRQAQVDAEKCNHIKR